MRVRRRSGATAWIPRVCVEHMHAEPHPDRMTQRRMLLSRLSFSTIHEQCSPRQEQSMDKRNFRRVIAPASLVLGVCGVGSAAVPVRIARWNPHPINPQLCHNPEGPPSTPPEPGGYCDIEVQLTARECTNGQGAADSSRTPQTAERSVEVRATRHTTCVCCFSPGRYGGTAFWWWCPWTAREQPPAGNRRETQRCLPSVLGRAGSGEHPSRAALD